MSAEIASLEKVRGAVMLIRAQGSVATADRVIAHLGGGSKATVLRHIKALREADAPEDAIPQGIMELARAALGNIYTAGVTAGTDRGAAGLARLTSAIAELDAQVEELAAENGSLVEQLGATKAAHDTAAREAEAIKEALAASDRELVAARNELAAERRASTEKLAALMSRLEASVNSIARKSGANGKQHRDRRSP